MATKKLTIEIELSEEEAEALDRYIEKGCYDREKLLKRWVLDMIGKGIYPKENPDYWHGVPKHHPRDPALFA
jgi:hypothetical protein